MKATLLLFLSVFFSVANGYTQILIPAQQVWGTSGDNYFQGMDLTDDGGYVIAGTTLPVYEGGITVTKYDQNGNKEWSGYFGDGYRVAGIQQCPDGGYVLGYSASTGYDGESQYVAVRLNTEGVVQWSRYFGEEDYYYSLQSIAATEDNGCILGGYSSFDWGGDTHVEVIRLDSMGTVQFQRALGSRDGSCNAIIPTRDHAYALVGFQSWSSRDYWLAKLTKRGTIEWEKTFPADATDNATALIQLGDGGFVIGGTSNSNKSGDKSEDSRGSNDYWIIRTDSAGNMVADKTIGGTGDDELKDIEHTTDDGIIAGGFSSSDSSFEKREDSKGGSDYWVVKLNPSGEIQWDKTIGGDTTDQLVSVKEKEKNVYILGGSSLSGISGNKRKPSHGGWDYWLVELNLNRPETGPVASVQPLPATAAGKSVFRVYPNPAHDVVTIQTVGTVKVSLVNTAGNTVLTKTIHENGQLDVSTLPSGVYWLKNQTTGAVVKLVVL